MATGDRNRSRSIAPQGRGSARAPQDHPSLNTTGDSTGGRVTGLVAENARLEGQLRGAQADTDDYNSRGRVHRFHNKAPRP